MQLQWNEYKINFKLKLKEETNRVKVYAHQKNALKINYIRIHLIKYKV